MKLTISISHLIFLTRDERYALVSGEQVKALGVSLPVWFYKGSTSEPAEEVFCRYQITAIPKSTPVKYLKSGYAFNLPQPQPNSMELSDEQYKNMTRDQREVWYRGRISQPSVLDLRDIKDGGSEQLALRMSTVKKIEDQRVPVVHFIMIRDVCILKNSMTEAMWD